MRGEGGEKGKHVRGKGRDQNHSSYRRKIADPGLLVLDLCKQGMSMAGTTLRQSANAQD